QLHPLPEPLNLFFGEQGPGLDLVSLWYLVVRVGQTLREIVVVGHHQKPASVHIEPPHRGEPGARAFRKLIYRGPTFRIPPGGQIPLWFIQENVDRSRFFEGLAVKTDSVPIHVHPLVRIPRHGAVYGYPSATDPTACIGARTSPRF